CAPPPCPTRRSSDLDRALTVAATTVVGLGVLALTDAAILARLGYLPVTLVMAPFDPVMRAPFQDFVGPGPLLQVALLTGGALLRSEEHTSELQSREN